MHDLFRSGEKYGYRLQGTFYRTSIKTPFNPPAERTNMECKKQTIIPFGPQHPVLPEPIHLDLVLEDENWLKLFHRSDSFIAAWKNLLKKDFMNMFTLRRESAVSAALFMTYCAIERS